MQISSSLSEDEELSTSTSETEHIEPRNIEEADVLSISSAYESTSLSTLRNNISSKHNNKYYHFK